MSDEKLTADDVSLAFCNALNSEAGNVAEAEEVLARLIAQQKAEHEREVGELTHNRESALDALGLARGEHASALVELGAVSKQLADLKREHEAQFARLEESNRLADNRFNRIADLERQVTVLNEREKDHCTRLAELTAQLSDRFDVGKNGVHKVSVMAYDKAGKLLYQYELEQFDAEREAKERPNTLCGMTPAEARALESELHAMEATHPEVKAARENLDRVTDEIASERAKGRE